MIRANNRPRRRNQVRRGRQKRNGRNGETREQQLLAYGPGSIKTVQPVANSLSVVLKYQDPDWIYGNSGGYVWSQRFRMNSVYDPDPHVLSGGVVTYFNEYAALYSRYRVIKFDYSVTCVNNTDEPVIFTVAPSKEDLGDNYVDMLELCEVTKGRTALLSANGAMNKFTIGGSVNLATYSGYPGYLTDDITSSRVDTNPSTLFYLNVGVNSNIAQSASSFGVRTYLTYHVIFFEPKTDVSALALRSQARAKSLKVQLTDKEENFSLG